MRDNAFSMKSLQILGNERFQFALRHATRFSTNGLAIFQKYKTRYRGDVVFRGRLHSLIYIDFCEDDIVHFG